MTESERDCLLNAIEASKEASKDNSGRIEGEGRKESVKKSGKSMRGRKEQEKK